MTKIDNSNIHYEISSLANSLDDAARRIRAMWQVKGANDTSPLDRAKLHYRNRRKRERIFGNNDLFGEPAWDMIIDLFIAGEEGKRVSVSSLCIASAGPATTALRWIAILENAEIVERKADRNDARRFFLTLSAKARHRVEQHFMDYG